MKLKEMLLNERIREISLITLFILFFLGIGLLMLFYVYKNPNIGHGDGANAAIVARNLAEGKGYTVDYVMYFVTYYGEISHPEDLWPLGLPTLISIFFKIFGVSTFIAKLPNLLLFLIFVLALFYILKRNCNTFIAFFTSIIILVNLNLFRVVREPYNDIGFLIFINFSFLAMSLWWLEQKKKYLVLLGLLVGLTILFKQTGVLLLPFFAFIIILRVIKKEKSITKSALNSTLLFLLVALVVASPWLIRNTILFDHPTYSLAWIISPVSEVPGTQQDEYFRIFFNEPVIKPLKEPTVHESITSSLRAWNHFARTIREDEIVPGVILFLFLFALVLLDFSEFEKSLIKISVLFIFVYVLFIIYYAHVEARYFLFVIPFISFISAKLLHSFYLQIIKLHYKFIYILILCSLLFYVTFPILSDVYYGYKQFSEDPIISLVESNTLPDAVVMTRSAPAITWHTGRKTVMIPFGNFSDFYTIIKAYNVSHVLVTDPLWYYATFLGVRPWVYDLCEYSDNRPPENFCAPDVEKENIKPFLRLVNITGNDNVLYYVDRNSLNNFP